MAPKPQVGNPDVWTLLQVRLPGWLRNDVVRLCEKQGVSINAWVVEILRSAVRAEQGVPEPPQAVNPIPSAADEIRAYVKKQKLLSPCGKEHPCSGLQAGEFFEHSGMSFCGECQIRVF